MFKILKLLKNFENIENIVMLKNVKNMKNIENVGDIRILLKFYGKILKKINNVFRYSKKCYYHEDKN